MATEKQAKKAEKEQLSEGQEAHLADIFEAHPHTQALYITSDGQIFTDCSRLWAESHAQTLPDKAIKVVDRS